MPDFPTPRRGQWLASDHPLVDAGPPPDCISDVPAELLDEVAAYHDDAEPPVTPVPDEELV